MAETVDAVIIGGGILGISTGHFLAKLGFGKVVVLEQYTLGAGSTGKSAAVVRSFYSNGVCVQLARRGLELFESFREQLGDDVGFTRIGYLVITDRTGVIDPVLELHHQYGLKSLKLDRDQIREMLPHMNVEDIAVGGFEPNSGFADPHLTIHALAKKAGEWGLRILQKCEVEKVKMTGERIDSVLTTRGAFSTRVLVNAAGPWAAQIQGVPKLSVPFRISRETDCIFSPPEAFRHNPVVSDSIFGSYSRSHVSGRLLAGLGYPKELEPCDPNNFDERAGHDFAVDLKNRLVRRFPTLRDSPMIHGWSGMYTITPDWHPIVGKAPAGEGYFLAVGGSGHCFKIGPPLGEALAQIITGRKPDIDISPLRYGRFQEGQLLGSVWGAGNRA